MGNGKRSYSVENLDAITDAIRSASIAASESALRKATLAGARVYFNEIKVRAMAHYRTGNLEDSLLIAYDPSDSITGVRASYIVGFNKKAWYARLLEYGTSKMAAKPFIRPGFDAKQTECAAAVEASLMESIANDK